MHWCDLCKCWMNDSKAARLNHERGAKHTENLARKLREMAKKAEADKREEKQVAEAMGNIEAAAEAAYALDKEAAEAAQRAAVSAAAEAAGAWDWDEGSSYYYNERHRWYYDPKTKWYYGGEPVTWVQIPPQSALPAAARFGAAPHKGGPEPQIKASGSGAAAAAAAGSGAAAGTHGGAGSSVVVKTVKKVVALPQHPQALIGGHQMHHVGGRIGGAKGVGSGDVDGNDSTKRKREQKAEPAAGAKGATGKPLDPAEAAALARREAARQRVQQRTQQAFGLS